jgi:hypothetical protein
VLDLAGNAHDPEKWEPVFGSDHAPNYRDAHGRTQNRYPLLLAVRWRDPAKWEPVFGLDHAQARGVIGS